MLHFQSGLVFTFLKVIVPESVARCPIASQSRWMVTPAVFAGTRLPWTPSNGLVAIPFHLRIECPNHDVIGFGGAGCVDLLSVDQKAAVGLRNGDGFPWIVDFAAGFGDCKPEDGVLVE